MNDAELAIEIRSSVDVLAGAWVGARLSGVHARLTTSAGTRPGAVTAVHLHAPPGAESNAPALQLCVARLNAGLALAAERGIIVLLAIVEPAVDGQPDVQTRPSIIVNGFRRELAGESPSSAGEMQLPTA